MTTNVSTKLKIGMLEHWTSNTMVVCLADANGELLRSKTMTAEEPHSVWTVYEDAKATAPFSGSLTNAVSITNSAEETIHVHKISIIRSSEMYSGIEDVIDEDVADIVWHLDSPVEIRPDHSLTINKIEVEIGDA